MSAEHPDLARLEEQRRAPTPEVAEHLAACEPCAQLFADLVAQAALEEEVRARLAPTRRIAPVIPGYEDLRLVASGGQGTVWRARQTSTRRDVALKVFFGAAFAGPRSRARFEREVELAAGLRHPHLITVFDSGTTDDGAAWFAMEFIDGAPFAAWARAPQRERADVLDALIALCRAVDAAHRRGVLHRDLKSSNVLVDSDGVPHVLDFGLAARSAEGAADSERLTRTGEFMGTLAYASPEHVAGDPALLDIRSDVYSLGVLAFEALTGAMPLDARGPSHTVAQRIARGALDLEPLRRLPTDLATVLRKAMALDPERRYATAGALGLDLEHFRRGRAIDARRDSTAYLLRRTIAQHRVAVGVGALFVLVTAGAALVSLIQLDRAVESRRTAEVEAERANELSAFWRELFDAIDPDEARGRRYDVREVLDAAAARMAAAPPRSAAAELELNTALGRTYFKLGYERLAWRQLRRAAELSRGVHGPSAARTLSIHADAATAALLAAPLADAEVAVQRLREVGGTPWSLAQASAQLALRAGDSAAALAALEDGLAALELDPTPDLVGACSVLAKLCEAALLRGDLAAAEGFARRALPLAERRRGREGLLAATARYQLGVVLEVRGRRSEAAPLLLDSAQTFERSLGAADPRALTARAVAALSAEPAQTLAALRARVPDLIASGTLHCATALGAIGALASERGEYALALEAFSGQRQLLREFYAPGSPVVRFVEVQLAECHTELRDGEEAVASADRALDDLDDETRALPRLMARARLARALGLILVNDLERARGELELARRAALGDMLGSMLGGIDDAQLALSLTRTSVFLAACSGALGEAERELRAALREAAPSSRAWASLASDLGDVLLQQLRAAEAEPLLRSALEVRRSELGAQHVDTADTANKLGTALFHQGKGPPELPDLWRDALQALESAGTERPALASVLNNLGAWAQLVERDKDRAEALLRRGLAVAERVYAPTDVLLATSLANVALFDQDRGDHTRAAERAARALAIMEARLGVDHPHVAQVRDALAVSRAALGER